MKNKPSSDLNTYRFYSEALIHRSYLNEHPQEKSHNERLEFLGDAVLELIVSEALYRHYSSQPEGVLTAMRSNLVNTQNLGLWAKKLGLDKKVKLSRGEEEGGGRNNLSLLADTYEAVIGAIYLQDGFKAASNFIQQTVLSNLKTVAQKPLKDAKSLLQEKVQAKGYTTPVYQLISQNGPDHNRTFEMEVIINHRSWGQGTGKNKAEAEQEAARKALKTLEKNQASG